MNIFTDYHHEDALDSLYRLFEGRLGMKVYIPGDGEYYKNGYTKLNSTPSLYCRHFNPINMGFSILSNRVDTKFPFRHVPFKYFGDIKFDIFLPTHPLNFEGFKRMAVLNNPHAKLIFRAGNNWPNLPWAGINNLLLPSIGTYFNGMTPLFKMVPYNKRELLYGGYRWSEETKNGPVNACYMHSEFNPSLFYPTFETKQSNFMVSLMHCLSQENSEYLISLCQKMGWELKLFGIANRDGSICDKRDEAKFLQRAGFLGQLKVADDGYGFNVHRAAYCGCQIVTRTSYYKGRFTPELYSSACLLFTDKTFIDVDLGDDYVLSELKNRSENLEEYYRYSVQHSHNVINFDSEEQHIRKFIENLI